MTIAPDNARQPAFTIGDRMRKARELTGMDRSEFARHIEIHRDTVARYESGKQRPKRSAIMAWAMAAGGDLAWLEHGSVLPSKLPDLDSNQEPIVMRARSVPRSKRDAA